MKFRYLLFLTHTNNRDDVYPNLQLQEYSHLKKKRAAKKLWKKYLSSLQEYESHRKSLPTTSSLLICNYVHRSLGQKLQTYMKNQQNYSYPIKLNVTSCQHIKAALQQCTAEITTDWGRACILQTSRCSLHHMLTIVVLCHLKHYRYFCPHQLEKVLSQGSQGSSYMYGIVRVDISVWKLNSSNLNTMGADYCSIGRLSVGKFKEKLRSKNLDAELIRLAGLNCIYFLTLLKCACRNNQSLGFRTFWTLHLPEFVNQFNSSVT